MWEHAKEYERVCKALRKAEKARGFIMVSYYETLSRNRGCARVCLGYAATNLSAVTGLTYREARRIIKVWEEQLEEFLENI